MKTYIISEEEKLLLDNAKAKAKQKTERLSEWKKTPYGSVMSNINKMLHVARKNGKEDRIKILEDRKIRLKELKYYIETGKYNLLPLDLREFFKKYMD